MKRAIYKLVLRFISTKISNGNPLNPTYLYERGWVKEYDKVREKEYWVEPNIKDRDKVWIEFEKTWYRVWHGRDKTFIALEHSVEWLENYFILIHADNRNKKDILKTH